MDHKFVEKKQSFSLITLIFLVVANMIGAGVFTTSGFSLQILQSPTMVMLSWLVGGLVALSGAVSYGMLSKEISGSGGEYLFLKTRLGDFAGFIGGALSLVVGFSASAAYAAITLESYLAVDYGQIQPGMIAVGLVIFLFILHSLPSHMGAMLQNTIVIVKIFAICVFIVYAFSHLPSTFAFNYQVKPVSCFTFCSSLIWVAFSYSGFNAAIYVAGESFNPHKNIARALIIGTLITVILYLLLNFIFVFFTPTKLIYGEINMALNSAKFIGGSSLESFIKWVVIVALFTSISSLFMAGPRVYSKMSEDESFLPSFKNKQWQHFFSNTLQGTLVILLILNSHLRELLSYIGMTLTFSCIITVGTLFSTRGRYSFRQLFFPALFILSSFTILVCAFINEPKQALACCFTFFVIALLYHLLKFKHRHRLKSHSRYV